MYIPIVFGVNVYGSIPPFLGLFYKFVEQAYKYNWPIIAQEEYFIDPNYYKDLYNYDIEKIFEIHNIKNVNNNIFKKIRQYIIPKEISESIIKESGNIDDAWIKLMNTRFNDLELFLTKTLKNIESTSNEPIRGILVWRHNKSVECVAKKMGIKVIEMEFTSIRYPIYNERISFFQFTNKFSIDEFNERYLKYEKEKDDSIPILTRKELLTLFLDKEYIDYIKKIDDNEMYDYGVALGLDKDYESKSTFSLSNQEVIDFSEELCENNNILFRKHPASKFDFKEGINVDDSSNSPEFIMKCKRIISCLSNISFEAMLYGKVSYILGKMPYQKCGIENNIITEEVVSLDKLNYIIFGFYVPYDLMLEKDYLDFRMNNPNETDIYKKHLDYYLSKRKISLNIFQKTGIKRLKEILKNMGYDNIEEYVTYGKSVIKKEQNEQQSKLENDILFYKEEEEKLKNEKIKLENDILFYKEEEEKLKNEKTKLENTISIYKEEEKKLKNEKTKLENDISIYKEIEEKLKSKIIKLENDVLLHNKIENHLKEEKFNLEKLIKNKSLENKELNKKNKKQNETIKKIKEEIRLKNIEIKTKQDFIDNTISSTSWKITKPLRIISNMFIKK